MKCSIKLSQKRFCLSRLTTPKHGSSSAWKVYSKTGNALSLLKFRSMIEVSIVAGPVLTGGTGKTEQQASRKNQNPEHQSIRGYATMGGRIHSPSYSPHGRGKQLDNNCSEDASTNQEDSSHTVLTSGVCGRG